MTHPALPEYRVSFDIRGYVNAVTRRTSSKPLVEATYEKDGQKLKTSHFDEKEENYLQNIPTDFADAPEEIQRIFYARKREPVRELAKTRELSNIIETN